MFAEIVACFSWKNRSGQTVGVGLWPLVTVLLLAGLLLAGCVVPGGANSGAVDSGAGSSTGEIVADACADGVGSNNWAQGQGFEHRVELEFAQNFVVEYGPTYKIVTIDSPWQGAQEVFRYLLVQCGTAVPQGYDDHQVIQIPVASVAALSTTVLPRLDRLGVVERVVAIEDTALVNTPSVRARIDAGEIVAVGGVEINVEPLLDVDPDIIWAFAYGDPQFDMHPKLVEVGLPVVLIADYMEPTPLARAEWLKYYALFFNLEAEAEAQFAQIVEDYLTMAQTAQAIENKPTVFAGVPRGDSWRVPAGHSYLAHFLADAGADYLWAELEGTGSLPLSFEVVYERALDADFWVPNTGAWATIADVLSADERYGDFAAVVGANVFNNTGRINEFGGNDYWETGISNPHWVLADLIAVFHPDLLPDHEPVFYRRLTPTDDTSDNSSGDTSGDTSGETEGE